MHRMPGRCPRPPSITAGEILGSPRQTLILGAVVSLSFIPVYVGVNLSQLGLLVISVAVLATYAVRPYSWAMPRSGIALPLVLIAAIVVCQAVGIAHSRVEEKNLLTPVLFVGSLLIASVTRTLARSMDAESLARLVTNTAPTIVVFFCFECVTRYILSPYMQSQRRDDFYAFKSSLFYLDANFVGIAILCFFAILIAFPSSRSPKSMSLIYALLAATISRASMVAGLCQFAIWKSGHWRRWVVRLIVVAQPVIIYYLFGQYVDTGAETVQSVDGSLASKFYILQQMTQTFSAADWPQKFFGIGVGNTDHLIGIYAHNILVTFVLELGIIGSALVVAYVWLLCRKSPSAQYLLVLPVVVNGFALVSSSMPYFFVTLGLLGAVEGPIVTGGGSIRQNRFGIWSTMKRLWQHPEPQAHGTN